MQISAKNFTLSYSMQGSGKEAKELAKNNLKSLGIDVEKNDFFKNISDDAFIQQSFEISITEITIQGNLDEIIKNRGNISEFLKDFKDLSKINTDDLLGEDGYFGIKNTAKRLSDFVLNNANDDIEKIRDGKKGLLAGFNEASKNLKHTDLAERSIQRAIQMIDEQIAKMGENILSFKA